VQLRSIKKGAVWFPFFIRYRFLLFNSSSIGLSCEALKSKAGKRAKRATKLEENNRSTTDRYNTEAKMANAKAMQTPSMV